MRLYPIDLSFSLVHAINYKEDKIEITRIDGGGLLQHKGFAVIGRLDSSGNQNPNRELVAFFNSLSGSYNVLLDVVERGREGTVAQAWPAGTLVEIFVGDRELQHDPSKTIIYKYLKNKYGTR